MKFFILTVCFVLLTLTLPACMLSAAMTGAQAVYNRHSIGKTWSENYATLQAYRVIYLDTDEYQGTHLSIATFNDSLLIAGQIPNPNHKTKLKNLIKQIAGARILHDYTEIRTPSSTLTRASDTWITSKIKAQFIARNEVDPTQIKVLTENGTVYLMGILPHHQAEIAIDIAKNTAGVQNIVKLFSYITISKT